MDELSHEHLMKFQITEDEPQTVINKLYSLKEYTELLDDPFVNHYIVRLKNRFSSLENCNLISGFLF